MQQLIEVNQKICRLRSIATDGAMPIKKTAAALQQEISWEVGQPLERIFRQRQSAGGLDLEGVEIAVGVARLLATQQVL